MTKKTEIATTTAAATGLSFLFQPTEGATNLPAHLQGNDNRGNENVSNEDVQQPRLRLLQLISDEVKPTNSEFIEGAAAGQMLDSVTKEVFDVAYVVNLYFRTSWNLWKDRKKGGGLKAVCASETEGLQELAKFVEAEGIRPDDITRINETFELVHTPEHLCLRIDPETGELSPIIVDMPKTKAKVSRLWNSLIRSQKMGARFAHCYKITTFMDKNSSGDEYFNYKIEYAGPLTEALFKKAEQAYATIPEVINGVAHSDDTEEGADE